MYCEIVIHPWSKHEEQWKLKQWYHWVHRISETANIDKKIAIKTDLPNTINAVPRIAAPVDLVSSHTVR